MAAPIIFTIRGHPKHVASKTSYKDKKAPVEFFANFKKLMLNLNYIIMMLSFSLSFAIYSTLGGVVSPLTSKFEFNSNETAVFGVVFILAGLIGSFTHAFFLDKWKKFKLQFLLIILTGTLSLAGLNASFLTHSFAFVNVVICVFGFCLIPIIGIGYAYTSINF